MVKEREFLNTHFGKSLSLSCGKMSFRLRVAKVNYVSSVVASVANYLIGKTCNLITID